MRFHSLGPGLRPWPYRGLAGPRTTPGAWATGGWDSLRRQLWPRQVDEGRQPRGHHVRVTRVRQGWMRGVSRPCARALQAGCAGQPRQMPGLELHPPSGLIGALETGAMRREPQSPRRSSGPHRPPPSGAGSILGNLPAEASFAPPRGMPQCRLLPSDLIALLPQLGTVRGTFNQAAYDSSAKYSSSLRISVSGQRPRLKWAHFPRTRRYQGNCDYFNCTGGDPLALQHNQPFDVELFHGWSDACL